MKSHIFLNGQQSNQTDPFQDTLPEINNLREKLQEAKSSLDQEQLKSADLDSKCDRKLLHYNFALLFLFV